MLENSVLGGGSLLEPSKMSTQLANSSVSRSPKTSIKNGVVYSKEQRSGGKDGSKNPSL